MENYNKELARAKGLKLITEQEEIAEKLKNTDNEARKLLGTFQDIYKFNQKKFLMPWNDILPKQKK